MHSHEDLVDMPDWQLLRLAPEATHQHFKGGLYRLVAVSLRDSETGAEVLAPDGSSMIVYEHIYPHEREHWQRPASEFYGLKDDRARFRELGR